MPSIWSVGFDEDRKTTLYRPRLPHSSARAFPSRRLRGRKHGYRPSERTRKAAGSEDDRIRVEGDPELRRFAPRMPCSDRSSDRPPRPARTDMLTKAHAKATESGINPYGSH